MGQATFTKNKIGDPFNDPLFEGSSSQPQAVYWRYDGRGRVWSTNAGDGIAKILAYNLDGDTGQETARFVSPTQNLSQLAYFFPRRYAGDVQSGRYADPRFVFCSE